MIAGLYANNRSDMLKKIMIEEFKTSWTDPAEKVADNIIRRLRDSGVEDKIYNRMGDTLTRTQLDEILSIILEDK